MEEAQPLLDGKEALGDLVAEDVSGGDVDEPAVGGDALALRALARARRPGDDDNLGHAAGDTLGHEVLLSGVVE